MRTKSQILAVGLVGALLLLGGGACSSNGGGNGETPTATAMSGGGTPTATQPNTGEAPTATQATGNGTPAATQPSGGGTNVNVDLYEFGVLPSVDTATAGPITFNANNIGGIDHEMLIVKTDLAPDALPTNADGSVDETAAGLQVVDKIDAFPRNTSQSLTADLGPGNYVLVCNLVQDQNGTTISHYQKGMYTGFQVTQ